MAPGHTACGVTRPRCLQQPHTAPAFRQVNWVLQVAPSLRRHGQGSARGPQPLPVPLPGAHCQPISLSLVHPATWVGDVAQSPARPGPALLLVGLPAQSHVSCLSSGPGPHIPEGRGSTASLEVRPQPWGCLPSLTEGTVPPGSPPELFPWGLVFPLSCMWAPPCSQISTSTDCAKAGLRAV